MRSAAAAAVSACSSQPSANAAHPLGGVAGENNHQKSCDGADDRHRHELAGQLADLSSADLSADHPIISQQELNNRKQVVQHVINGLSNRQREAIYLYFFENIGYESIAEIMSMKEVKYARTLFYRALDEMREVITRNKKLTELL